MSDEDDWDIDNSVDASASGSVVADGLLRHIMKLEESIHKPFAEMSDEELREWVASSWRAPDYLEGCKIYAERCRKKESGKTE